MTPPAHLTDEQFARYRDCALTAVELLALDEHLAGCAPCRDRLYAQRHASARIQAVRAGISGHLEFDAIVACSEGTGSEEQRRHLRDCAACQAEALDLSRFRTELLETRRAPATAPKRDWSRLRVPIGIAAAVLLAGAGIWTFGRRPAPATPPTPAEAALPAAERQMLDLAIARRRLERAPILDQLLGKPGAVPPPGSGSTHFRLLAPVGSTVMSERPVLRWTPLDGASSYVVSIFDERLDKVAESPALTGTDWRPDAPLPRGRVLSWQVNAGLRGAQERAPAPGLPEARFAVVPQEVADHIEAIRRAHPGNPLLLAVLYAHAGALDDAEQALVGMDLTVTQEFQESIEKIRKPERQ